VEKNNTVSIYIFQNIRFVYTCNTQGQMVTKLTVEPGILPI